MLPKEIIRKIKRIQITTSRLVNESLAGEYHSVFKGRGMEFDEVREYQIGDDVRAIDWNVTARTGAAHIKKYIEERELTVMIMVDASSSCHFGSTQTLKSVLAAEIAAVLAFSAIRNNDKVGLLMFTDRIELYIPPRKGKTHVLRVIREVLYFKPKYIGTDIPGALRYLTKVLRRKSVAFMISDFFGDNFQKPLKITNKYHDVIAVTLNDPREEHLPDCGLVELSDAETGQRVVVDSSNSRVRRQYVQAAGQRYERRNRLFASTHVDHIDVRTDVPYAQELVRFFSRRKKRH